MIRFFFHASNIPLFNLTILREVTEVLFKNNQSSSFVSLPFLVYPRSPVLVWSNKTEHWTHILSSFDARLAVVSCLFPPLLCLQVHKHYLQGRHPTFILVLNPDNFKVVHSFGLFQEKLCLPAQNISLISPWLALKGLFGYRSVQECTHFYRKPSE